MLARRWLIDAGASLAFVDGGYADTWFSVDGADAAASGLGRHDAGGGLHDVGASLDVRRLLGERASLGARVAWRRLLGDAADSPIVAAEGDADQVLAALSLGWRF